MTESYAPTDVLVIAGCRTPMGRFCGSLACLPAHELGGHVIAGCIKRGVAQFSKVSETEVISHLTEVIMGQVFTAGGGQNPARRAAVAAGLPYYVPAWGLNMLCASGLKAVCQCAMDLRANGGVGIAGGQESMSRCPHMTPAGGSLRRAGGGGNAQNLPVFGDFHLVDSLVVDGLEDAFSGLLMGDTAENLAHLFKVSRERQDAFAFASQVKCKEAVDRGLFSAEIIPVFRPSSSDPKKSAVATPTTNGIASSPLLLADEPPRPQTTVEGLARLKPAFTSNLPTGHAATVTAGNSSCLSDGAAAVLLCRADLAVEMGVKCPLGRIVDWHQTGCEPEVMGMGPVNAVSGLLKKICWTTEDVDLFELNEAFAAQSVAVIESLSLPKERVNVCGGAIALGHPLGCSGARILVTLLYGLHRLAHEASANRVGDGANRRVRGVAALCVGGGMGLAIAVEVLSGQLSADCCVLKTVLCCQLLEASTAMPESRQFNTANCERTFVQRDFSEGTAVRFQTSPLPPRLSGKISPEEFAKAISELNQLFDEAEALSAAVICENITACLFAYMLFLCMPTHYERVLEKISYRVIQLNSEVFVPKGLLMIDPAERGLRVIEICIMDSNEVRT